MKEKRVDCGLCGECRYFDQNHNADHRAIRGICLQTGTGIYKTLAIYYSKEVLKSTEEIKTRDHCFLRFSHDPFLHALRYYLIEHNELNSSLDLYLREKTAVTRTPVILALS